MPSRPSPRSSGPKRRGWTGRYRRAVSTTWRARCRRVRGSTRVLRGVALKIWRTRLPPASALPPPPGASPGTVLAAVDDGLFGPRRRSAADRSSRSAAARSAPRAGRRFRARRAAAGRRLVRDVPECRLSRRVTRRTECESLARARHRRVCAATAAWVVERVLETLAPADASWPSASPASTNATRGCCASWSLGTLRWLRRLDDVLERASRRPLAEIEPALRAPLRVAAYQLLFLDRVPAYAVVDDAVELAAPRHAPRRLVVRQRRAAPHRAATAPRRLADRLGDPGRRGGSAGDRAQPSDLPRASLARALRPPTRPSTCWPPTIARNRSTSSPFAIAAAASSWPRS